MLLSVIIIFFVQNLITSTSVVQYHKKSTKSLNISLSELSGDTKLKLTTTRKKCCCLLLHCTAENLIKRQPLYLSSHTPVRYKVRTMIPHSFGCQQSFLQVDWAFWQTRLNNTRLCRLSIVLNLKDFTATELVK